MKLEDLLGNSMFVQNLELKKAPLWFLTVALTYSLFLSIQLSSYYKWLIVVFILCLLLTIVITLSFFKTTRISNIETNYVKLAIAGSIGSSIIACFLNISNTEHNNIAFTVSLLVAVLQISFLTPYRNQTSIETSEESKSRDVNKIQLVIITGVLAIALHNALGSYALRTKLGEIHLENFPKVAISHLDPHPPKEGFKNNENSWISKGNEMPFYAVELIKDMQPLDKKVLYTYKLLAKEIDTSVLIRDYRKFVIQERRYLILSAILLVGWMLCITRWALTFLNV